MTEDSGPIELEYLPADVLGLSPTARVALAGRPNPSALPDVCVPATLDDLPRVSSRLDDDQRKGLAERIAASLSVHEPHVAVLDSARALRDPGCAVVIAGQQPAFLGGPLYNVFKALHAIRLARALAGAWGRPVVPVFWNHADDHDIAEVHHLWIQTPSLDLRKVGLKGTSSGRTPLSRIVFEEKRHGLRATSELLEHELFVAPGLGEELEAFLPRDGESLATAFTRLLLHLFGHHGLLVIEPDTIRAELSRELAEVVTRNLLAELEKGSAALEEAGMPAPIDASSAALVFRLIEGQRRALRARGEDFSFDDEPGSRTSAELAAEIVQDPSDFSPGALLRPILQDSVLPVAAYVGGWGELAYHAQLGALRKACGTPLTPFVPRLSATLVDSQSRASMRKLGVSTDDVLRARGKLGEGELTSEAAPEVIGRLQEIGERAARELAAQREELAALDRGLSAQLGRSAKRVRDTIETLAAKARRVHANTSGKGRAHLRRLNHGLVPRDEPQERIRGAIEFVARFGRDWIDALLEEIDPLPTEHLVVHLEDRTERRKDP